MSEILKMWKISVVNKEIGQEDFQNNGDRASCENLITYLIIYVHLSYSLTYSFTAILYYYLTYVLIALLIYRLLCFFVYCFDHFLPY